MNVDTDVHPRDQPPEVLEELYERHDGVVRHVAKALDAPDGTTHNVLVDRGIHECDPSPFHQLAQLDDLPGLQDEDDNWEGLRADGSGDCHRCSADATGADSQGRPVCRCCAADQADDGQGWS